MDWTQIASSDNLLILKPNVFAFIIHHIYKPLFYFFNISASAVGSQHDQKYYCFFFYIQF